MAKKAFLKDHDDIEILPITRGELILDSSGNPAFHSNEFLATTSKPGLMSAEDKYKIANMQASSVANALTLKINGGSTEGTNLYTFTGSAAKTLNIVAGDNITLTPSAGVLSISATTSAAIDAYTKTESDNRYLQLSGGTITSGGNTPLSIKTTAANSWVGIRFYGSDNTIQGNLGVQNDTPYYVNAALTNKYTLLHAGNIKDYNAGSATKLATTRSIWGQSFDGTADVMGDLSLASNKILGYGGNSILSSSSTSLSIGHGLSEQGISTYINGASIHLRYGTSHTTAMLINSSGNVGIGTTDPKSKLQVNGNVKATSFIGNLDGTYVNKLTGYTKATTVAGITSEDSLNTALGKLELKADTTYELVKGAYDGDGTIENLAEILKVLEGIKDTETIQAIVGKYLPLSGGTMSGIITLSHIFSAPSYIKFKDRRIGTSGYADRIISIVDGNDLVHGTFGLYGNSTGVQYYYLGHNGYDGANLRIYSDKLSFGDNTIIHTGNIGSYAVKYLGGSKADDARHSLGLDNGSQGSVNLPSGGGFITMGHDSYGAQLLGSYVTGTLYFRPLNNNSWGTWKTVAFTDSNVASATKLSDDTAYTAWGQKFFENGKPKNVDGHFYIKDKVRLHSNDGSELYVNYGGGANDGNLYLCGYNIQMFYGTSSKYNPGFLLNSSGKILIGTTTDNGAKLQVNGQVSASGFVKSSSSNSYLLLGGGGHKAISDFLLKSEVANQELSNNLTTITKSLTVTADWMDTGIKYTDLDSGTYIVQVSVNASDDTGYMYSNIFSGIMSWSNKSTNDNESDEIILHRAGVGYGKTIYLRTKMSTSSEGTNLRLQIAASQNIGAAYTYTFKFKRVI